MDNKTALRMDNQVVIKNSNKPVWAYPAAIALLVFLTYLVKHSQPFVEAC